MPVALLVFSASRPISYYEFGPDFDYPKQASMWWTELGRKEHLSILDAGTGNGQSMPRIRDYFEQMGFEVHVTGVDIESDLFGAYYMGWSPDKCSFVKSRIKDMNTRYDVVIINSPHGGVGRPRLEPAREALMLMKNDGIGVLRMHQGETEVADVQALAKELGLNLIVSYSLIDPLPSGWFPLDELMFIFKREPFVTDFEALARSLGEAMEGADKLGRSA
jgi:predicted RNA methylase